MNSVSFPPSGTQIHLTHVLPSFFSFCTYIYIHIYIFFSGKVTTTEKRRTILSWWALVSGFLLLSLINSFMLLLYWVLYVTLLLFLLTPLNNLKDMASSGEAYGMEESSSSTPKISLLDHVNGFHYNALKKSDNFVIDMDAFSHGINKDSTNNANSRITVSFFFFF